MFSVVIPLYNKEKSISRTIESVLAQNFPDFEVIVIDDGSTDSSIEQVRKYKDSRVKIYSTKNGGVSKARNNGIKLSCNPYIAFLDADDFWDSDYLLYMAQLIQKYPKAIIYSCRQNIILGENRASLSKVGSLNTNFEGYISNYFKRAVKTTLFNSSSIIVRRKDILKYNVSYLTALEKGEDLLFYFSLLKTGHKACFTMKPLSYYNVMAENRAMNKKGSFDKGIMGYYLKLDLYKEPQPYRKFISNYLIRNLLVINQLYDVDKKQQKEIKRKVIFKDLTFVHKLIFLMPSGLIDCLYSIKNKLYEKKI